MDFGELLNLGTTYLSYEAQKDAAKTTAEAATSAAEAGVEASDKQIDFSKWLFNQQTELQKPYYSVGTSALPMLQARAGIRPQAQKPTLQKIPRYSADQASKIDNVYDYVSNLYIEGLGREGNPQDIDKWVTGIANGQYDKKSVVDAFTTEAQNTGVQFDTTKLNSIKNAINVQNSLLSTNTQAPNFLRSYQRGGGENDNGRDGGFGATYGGYGTDYSQDDIESQNLSMGKNSPYGGISFSAIKDFASKYGKEATGTAGVFGGPLAGLITGTAVKLAEYLPDDDSSDGWGEGGTGGWGGYSSGEMDAAASQSDASSQADNPSDRDGGGDNGGSGAEGGGNSSGDGWSCFTAGTQVKVIDGNIKINMNIEDVEIGDILLGENNSRNKVLKFDRPKTLGRKLFNINGSEYFLTEEHPFLTKEGWKSINPEATEKNDTNMFYGTDMHKNSSLSVGDILIRIDGVEEIKSIESIEADSQTQLYNFKLDGNNTYSVNSYIVHNK